MFPPEPAEFSMVFAFWQCVQAEFWFETQ